MSDKPVFELSEEEMKLICIYRDENGRYHGRPRSKEEQERVDEYIRLRDKCEKEINNLYQNNPTQEDVVQEIQDALDRITNILAEPAVAKAIEEQNEGWRKTRGILKELV